MSANRFALATALFCVASHGLPAAEPARLASRNSLNDLSDTVERLVRRVNPAVLQIVSEGFGERDEDSSGEAKVVTRQPGGGTGFIGSQDASVITNAHDGTGPDCD